MRVIEKTEVDKQPKPCAKSMKARWFGARTVSS